MNDIERRKGIEKYFKPFPNWAVWAIVIGLALLFLGAQGSGGIAAMGFVVAAVGGLGAWMYLKARTTDQEFDQWRADDFALLDDKALAKLGMDRDDLVRDAVAIWGPGHGTQTEAFKKGKDGVLRYNPVRFCRILFGEHQLMTYEGILDLTTGNVLREGTDEYFYQDVVSASTKTQSTSFLFKGQTVQFNEAEVFSLTTSGGTSIEVFLRDPKLAQLMGGGNIPTTEAEQAVMTVKKMLREKKAIRG